MKKTLQTLFLIVIAFTINYAQTAPAAGDGSAGNPYQIATFDNLLWIQADNTRWGSYYIQTADITASPSGSDNWDRIGTDTHPFTGSYDGQNHTIGDVWIDTPFGQFGFFGVVDGAAISNVNLSNITITAKGSSIGGLVGESRGSTTIDNCSISGTITIDDPPEGSADGIGGFIGKCGHSTVGTEISNSHCAVNISGTNGYDVSGVGGFAGWIENGSTVTNCSATGNVQNGSSSNGGFVGYIELSGEAITVSKCYSTGDVELLNNSGSKYGTGGFLGYINSVSGSEYATISECYSRGNVTSSSVYAGGFLGRIRQYGTVENCYSFGNVTRSSGTDTQFGGFAGRLYNNTVTIEKCYSVGSVTYSSGSNPTDKGFVATLGSATCTNNFFDSEASGQTSDVAATAKTTTEMKTQSTFTDAGWDFGTIWEIIAPSSSAANNGLEKTNADGNYPRLQNQPDGALPVELTTFTASVNGTTVELNWETATEVNNYGFDVERRMENGDRRTETGNWNKVGFIEGAGNSNSVKHYSFSDNNNLAGKYYYRLKQIDIDGKYEYSNVIEVEIGIPEKFELLQNYPNPFNPTTEINFSLSKSGNTELSIYNILGQKVATLIDKELSAGTHTYKFDASSLTSGIYFYKLQSNDYTAIRKMTLLK